MDRSEVIAKIRNLLRLSRSTSVGEAAAAAAGAQRLAERHALDLASVMIEPDAISDHEDRPLDLLGPYAKQGWRVGLALVIAQHNGCEIVTEYRETDTWQRKARRARRRRKSEPQRPTAVLIVGPPDDVATVRYLYAFLHKEIDRLARRDCRGQGREYARSYRMGAVNTVLEVLHEANLRARHDFALWRSGPGLVPVEGVLARRDAQLERVRAWIEASMEIDQSDGYKPPQDDRGYAAGLRGAREIQIGDTAITPGAQALERKDTSCHDKPPRAARPPAGPSRVYPHPSPQSLVRQPTWWDAGRPPQMPPLPCLPPGLRWRPRTIRAAT